MTIIIDSDKTNINGNRIFPVGMYSMCNRDYEKTDVVGPCNPSDNKEFILSMGGPSITEMLSYKSLYEQARRQVLEKLPQMVACILPVILH